MRTLDYSGKYVRSLGISRYVKHCPQCGALDSRRRDTGTKLRAEWSPYLSCLDSNLDDMERRTMLRLGGLGGVILLSGCTSKPEPTGTSNPSGNSQTSTATPKVTTQDTTKSLQGTPSGTPEMVEKTFNSEYYSGDQQFSRTACGSSEDEFVTLTEAGRGRFILGVGLNGTIGCEEVNVLDNNFEPETGAYNVRLSLKPRSGAKSCDSGCTVTYFLRASYIATSTTKLIKNMTVTVERVNGTTEFDPVEPE